ncbi:hypothetical protein D0C36_11340 [Mucilaginibacter conchicola]|uniref:Uncharacterized protein n=1 Tax=Mucilaginibacter conchicola TaxID=2303333 RepID=A0A372NST6_9SPHI|nr:hypothetical protein [Mucilaginibacter conchicola]RFZ92034.1 hypothetical protein D0C36_11340 [Mucilaginibacter conchicola]
MDFGWKRIWGLYGWKELLSKRNKLFYFSAISNLIFIIILLISNHDANLPFELINKVLNIALGSLPTLLGFNLGAFALIIGFLSNENLVKALTEKHGSESPYHIEKISGVFAFNIIAQAIALLFSFLLSLIIDILDNINFEGILGNLNHNATSAIVTNYFILFITNFLTLYSIALVIQNAINIFDFNQLFTFFSIKKKEEKNK